MKKLLAEKNATTGFHRFTAAIAACLALAPLTGSAALTLTAEAQNSVLIANRPEQVMIRIALDAPPLPATERATPRVNLAIALDRSGSMNAQGKLANARQAAKDALALLSDNDTFSLVVYDSSAQVLIPSTSVTAENRSRLERQIDAIQPGGTTALFAGVSLAANELAKLPPEAGRVNRLILLSDGLANVGPNSPFELGRLGAGLIKEKISVSTIGVGNDYNEDLMTALAQNSDGNFYFVEHSRDLPLIFEKELGSALAVAAQELKIRITCPAGVTPRGILGYECAVQGQTIELDFNQIYAGHSKVLILQVEVPPTAAGKELKLAELQLQYRDLQNSAPPALTGEVKVRFTSDQADSVASLNKAVRRDVVLQETNVMREEALQAADRGDYDAGARKLEEAQAYAEQNAKLVNSSELAATAQKLDQESAKLKEAQTEPEEYKRVRKEVKGRSFQLRNSQSYQQ